MFDTLQITNRDGKDFAIPAELSGCVTIPSKSNKPVNDNHNQAETLQTTGFGQHKMLRSVEEKHCVLIFTIIMVLV